MTFAAALLAGGRSTRMGRDKAWLNVGGEPLWQRQLRVLRELHPATLMISARAEQGLRAEDALLVADEEDSRHKTQDSRATQPGARNLELEIQSGGPLPAIARCLGEAQMPVLALAVDMPRITAEVLRRCLIDRCDESAGVVLRAAHGFEPLAAMYSPAMLSMMEEALKAGDLSLQRVMERAVQRGLMRVIEMASEDVPFFHNVNTPQDIAEDKFSASTQLMRLRREGGIEYASDAIVREEPLEIRVEGRSVAVVMRTPGHDRELAAGFLVSEGVVQTGEDIIDILKCDDGEGRSKGNIINALLAKPDVDLDALTRHVFSASSCGLCGKTSIESVFQRFDAVRADWKVAPELLWSLPEKVRAAQDTFAKTGGLHACAIFDLHGNLTVLREDVGRHNALDKVLGYALLHRLLPFDQHILLLSGRVSFEMMQKALAAGVPLVAAISAPSSLAVQFAEESNQTLIGFLRERSMNVYAHARRIADHP